MYGLLCIKCNKRIQCNEWNIRMHCDECDGIMQCDDYNIGNAIWHMQYMEYNIIYKNTMFTIKWMQYNECSVSHAM